MCINIFLEQTSTNYNITKTVATKVFILKKEYHQPLIDANIYITLVFFNTWKSVGKTSVIIDNPGRSRRLTQGMKSKRQPCLNQSTPQEVTIVHPRLLFCKLIPQPSVLCHQLLEQDAFSVETVMCFIEVNVGNK